jgi:hypothetical protein
LKGKFPSIIFQVAMLPFANPLKHKPSSLFFILLVAHGRYLSERDTSHKQYLE